MYTLHFLIGTTGTGTLLVYYSLSSTRPVFASLSPRACRDATRQAHAQEKAGA